MFAIPIKILMIVGICITVYRLFAPHMDYAMPTMKELVQFPSVIISDVKNLVFR